MERARRRAVRQDGNELERPGLRGALRRGCQVLVRRLLLRKLPRYFIAGIWVAFFSRWHRYHCQQERKDCKQSHGVCWKRAQCDPEKFEKDAATVDFDTYFKNDQPPLPPPPPPPPPSHSHGALAYLKHDALGPRGDAAILVFNPGPAQKLTIDLSMLPGE